MTEYDDVKIEFYIVSKVQIVFPGRWSVGSVPLRCEIWDVEAPILSMTGIILLLLLLQEGNLSYVSRSVDKGKLEPEQNKGSKLRQYPRVKRGPPYLCRICLVI